MARLDSASHPIHGPRHLRGFDPLVTVEQALCATAGYGSRHHYEATFEVAMDAIVTAMETFRAEAGVAFGAYAYMKARFAVIDWLRARPRKGGKRVETVVVAELPCTVPSAERTLEVRQLTQHVASIRETFPTEDRSLVTQTLCNDESLRSWATRHNTSVSTASRRRRRLVGQLRRAMHRFAPKTQPSNPVVE